MILLCTLLLFLLGVDWLEDPHFGQSPFSRPMASQMCNAHRTLRQQEFSIDEHTALSDASLLTPSLLNSLVAPVERVLASSDCITSLYIFMSLQR